MSQVARPDFILETRGVPHDLGAFIVAAAFDRGSRAAAFALSDGTLRLISLADREQWREIAAHDGATLALAPDCGPGGFVSGGDDGRFIRIGADRGVAELAKYGSKWVEQVASHPGD